MTTPNKDLNLPANSSTNWDVPLNNNFSMVDSALGSSQPMSLTGFAGGNILLTGTFPVVSSPLASASYIPMRLAVTGVMTANATIQVPTGVDGMWIVSNKTSGAFTLQITGQGGGTSVTIPQSEEALVWCDGTNATSVGPAQLLGALPSIGDYKHSASSAAQPGWILCYGQPVSRTTYAALFAVIGTTFGAGDGSTTFNVPDRRGLVGAGADDMGGVAAGRLTGYTLNFVGGAQSVALTGAQNGPHTHTDSGHGHGVNDPTHTHPYTAFGGGSGFAPGAGFYGTFSSSTGGAYTNISIQTGYANIQSSGSGTAHANVQPTMADNVYIYAGV